MVRILFIDDDPGAHEVLRLVLPEDYGVLSAMTGEEGISAVCKEDPDLVLLDFDLPDLNGLEVLRRISANPGAPPVIMLTAFSQISLIVEAVKQGASAYIVKPYKLPELTAAIKTNVVHHLKTKDSGIDTPELADLIGEAPVFARAKRFILTFAPSDRPMLITGESGTGKELAARTAHRLSGRSDGAFVAVNCGAIPENLIETELFGSERGAYTDAVSRPGSFQRSSGGTLFLDEIAEMPLAAQVKLLRVIEDGQVTRIGGTQPIPIDVRIISATNARLSTALAEGRFRRDLFYRVSTLPVEMPPLRERVEDIPLLSRHFLQSLDSQQALSHSALEKLMRHDWPGNVRELRNVLERASLLAQEGSIESAHVVYQEG